MVNFNVDDIMREVNKSKQKVKTKDAAVQKPVTPSKSNEEPVVVQPKPTDVVKKESEPSVAATNPTEVQAAPVQKPVVAQPSKPTEPMDSAPVVKQDTPKAPSKNVVPEQASTVKSKPVAAQTTATQPVARQQGVQHPPIRRSIERQPENDFKQMSAVDKLAFKDLFVNDGAGVRFNAKFQKTVAKNLSKGIMDQVVDDLKQRHRGVQVWIGKNPYTIRETNDVFTSPTSTMRYLMLDQLKDENMALQVARQLFLEKHPTGEKQGFNHDLVRTDERDVYAVLLASKSDPTKEILEKIEELLLKVTDVQQSSQLADRQLLAQGLQANNTLGGLNMLSSLLLLERLGLTKGSIPQNLEEIKPFINQQDVVTLADMVNTDIARDVRSRQETMRRDARTRPSRLQPPVRKERDYER